MRKTLALASLTFLGLTASAAAQVDLYATDFAANDGWAFENHHPWGNQPQAPEWDIDALPASANLTPYRSAPYSLNFNHDQHGLEWGWWAGTASSPSIDLSRSLGTPELRFWYAFAHETDCQWDAFTVSVVGDAGGDVLFSECLSATSLALGVWTEFVLPLDRAWGSVRIVFGHDTLDDWNFNDQGSFVDDLAVVDPCGASVHCEGQPLSTGAAGATLTLSGSASIAENNLRMRGAGFPTSVFAAPFAGPAPGTITIGLGIRCIAGGSSVRLPIAPTRGTGTPHWTLALGEAPLNQIAMVGAPLYIQTIFRDGNSVNLSAAMRLVICP